MEDATLGRREKVGWKRSGRWSEESERNFRVVGARKRRGGRCTGGERRLGNCEGWKGGEDEIMEDKGAGGSRRRGKNDERED